MCAGSPLTVVIDILPGQFSPGVLRTFAPRKRRNKILRVLPFGGVTLGGVTMTSAGATGRVRLIGAAGRVPSRPAARRWWRDLAGSAAILSVVAVVGLWLANGGIQAFQAA